MLDDFVQAAQALERLLVSTVCARLQTAGLRQVQLLEQNLRELDGRADVEIVANGGVNVLLDATDLHRERLGHLA